MYMTRASSWTQVIARRGNVHWIVSGLWDSQRVVAMSRSTRVPGIPIMGNIGSGVAWVRLKVLLLSISMGPSVEMR
jgi:hypothetical protein